MEQKENTGRFKKGNEIGFETRFQPGNTFSKKYNAEYAESLIAYFCERSADVWLPTIEEWAVQNHIDIRSIYNWIADEKKYPRFASAYAQCKAIQRSCLMQRGLVEAYNPQMVKFLLSANHGMSEKAVQQIEGNAIAPVTVNIREVE